MLHTFHPSPIGTLTIGVANNHVHFVNLTNKKLANKYSSSRQVPAKEHPLLNQAVQEFTEYFSGRRTIFTLPFTYHSTPFRESVWEQLMTIPYGHTMSYGQLAQRIGGKNKARAVGGAAHHNPLLILIPCHRLIGADGSLTGFGSGISIKKQLLELENWR